MGLFIDGETCLILAVPIYTESMLGIKEPPYILRSFRYQPLRPLLGPVRILHL